MQMPSLLPCSLEGMVLRPYRYAGLWRVTLKQYWLNQNTFSLKLSFLLSEFSSLFLMATKIPHEITSNSTQSGFLAYQNHKYIRRILTNISFLSYSLNNLFAYMKLLSA